MLRVLIRTPRRRLAGLVLIVALAWAAWVLWPPAPEARWSLPPEEGRQAYCTPHGRTVITGQFHPGGALVSGNRVNAVAGPLVGRDAETGRERYRLFESGTTTALLPMSPDGRRLILAATPKDQTIPAHPTDLIVVDPADGRQLAALADVNFQIEDIKGVTRVRFLEQINPVSPDGRWLAYRRRGDDDLRVYDLDGGCEGPVLKDARPPMNFSPDGRTLAAQTADNRVGFWDVETGAARTAPADRGSEVRACGLWFSPDGRTLAAAVLAQAPFAKSPPAPSWRNGLEPQGIALWDVASGARRSDPPMPAGPNQWILGMSFSPDSRFLAVQTAWTDGWLWDLAADPPALVQLTPAGSSSSLELSGLPLLTTDGLALVATGPRELALFDPAMRERRQTFRLGHEHIRNVDDVRFSPDGRTLLVNYPAITWLGRLPLPDRLWTRLRQSGYVSDHNSVAAAFDVATGRPLRAVEVPSRRAVMFLATPHPFGAEGRSFWTVMSPAKLALDPVVFERWSVDPPGWPWWLLALTACAIGLAVADQARSRRKGV